MSVVVFVGAFFGCLVLNLDELQQPPPWDAAMGVFTPAIELARSGFDFADLLGKPGWFKGGPNVYTLSPLTWFTALAFVVFSPPTAITFLHIFHIAITALLVMMVFRVGREFLGPWLAVASAILVGCLPLVIVQTAYMYAEILVAVTSLLVIENLAQDKRWRAIAWGCLGLSLKASGLVSIGLIFAAIAVRSEPIKTRLRYLGGLVLATAMVFYPWTIQTDDVPKSFVANAEHFWSAFRQFLEIYVWRRMEVVPDVNVVLVISGLITLLMFERHFNGLRDGPSQTGLVPYPVSLLQINVVGFLCFILSVCAYGATFWMLPRYVVQVLPLAWLGLIWCVQEIVARMGKRTWMTQAVVAILVLIIAGVQFTNRDGRFYEPYHLRVFSLVERDESYKDFMLMQQDVARTLVAFPDHVPKYYPRPMGYFVSYPEMGYVDQRIENGYFISEKVPEKSANPEVFPDHFVFAMSNDGHGGELLNQLRKRLLQHGGYSIGVVTHSHGSFKGWVLEVKRKAS